MKIFLLTIVFALSVSIVFAQNTSTTPKVTTSDDSDGDGVKNSEDFNKQQYVYESLGWRSRKEQEIAKIRSDAIKLIEDFLEKRKGKLPQEMIDHLNGDIQKLRSGDTH